MPSDRRLHPLSVLFGIAAQLRAFFIPGLLVLFTAGRAGWGWDVWAMPFLVPYAIFTVARYVSFRYRYEASEMVIRSGILFRNERHIPYARIQNLDAVQNVFHRLLGVVTVRVETGGGSKPEATMSVLPIAAFEEMRQRVFGERAQTAPGATDAAAQAAAQTLLHLPPRELLLSGFIQNRGFVIVAAAWGVLWQVGMLDRFDDRFFGGRTFGLENSGSVGRALGRALLGRGGFPLGRVALALGGFVLFLLLLRLLSMGWALVRLYGFRITRAGEDLRSEYGLLTHVVTTIPLRRIQTLSIREGPLHRWFGRAAVRVETAGSGGSEDGDGGRKRQREWLAPILRRDDLPAFLRGVLPELATSRLLDPNAAWHPVHPRAFRRELKQWAIVAIALSLPFALLLRWWDLALFAAVLGWGAFSARRQVARLGWAVDDDLVLYKSGWIWRQVTVARFAKIQAVTIHESPFDRRAQMARVRVDTAGASETSHRVDIPYLARETARELHALLAAQAAHTAFRW